MAYLEYVQTYGKRSPKLQVSDAYLYVRSWGMTFDEVIDCTYSDDHAEYSDDHAESNWFAAIYHYVHTKDRRMCLYDRCIAERKMRKHWKTFRTFFQYAEPCVPPLPPITP